MGRVEGKVAVVTGATSGIGLAAARRFAAEGAHVFATGRNKTDLEAAVAEIGGNARGIQGDVGNLDDLDRLFAIVRDEAGGIDILFANAGVGEFAALRARPPLRLVVPSQRGPYRADCALNPKSSLPRSAEQPT